MIAIPWGIVARVAGVAAAVAACWWVIDTTLDSIEAQGYKRGVAEVQGRWDHETTARAVAELAEVQRRAEAQQEITRHADQRIAEARAAADDADAAASQLRKRAAELAARCDQVERPTAADPGASASGPGLVLRGLFEGADESASILARYADAAREAGLACERAYDSLSR